MNVKYGIIMAAPGMDMAIAMILDRINATEYFYKVCNSKKWVLVSSPAQESETRADSG
jgi:hypothetical protein